MYQGNKIFSWKEYAEFICKLSRLTKYKYIIYLKNWESFHKFNIKSQQSKFEKWNVMFKSESSCLFYILRMIVSSITISRDLNKLDGKRQVSIYCKWVP